MPKLYNTYFRHQSPDYKPGEGFLPTSNAETVLPLTYRYQSAHKLVKITDIKRENYYTRDVTRRNSSPPNGSSRYIM